MDFSAISSVKSYVKNLEMQQKWQKKKDENDFTPQSQIDRWIEEQRKQADGIPGSAVKNHEIKLRAVRRLPLRRRYICATMTPLHISS